MAQHILATKNNLRFISTATLLIFFISSSLGQTISGLVIKIADGDTLTILTPKKEQVKIRLTEIDAPEKKQAFGNVSRQSLAKICFRKNAVINYEKVDRYKRILGRVYCNGVDANAEQIHRGMAWVYDKYVTNKSLYKLQLEAQQSKAGLWADQYAMPPWNFRKK
ncbi:thermonuclease family protein [Legionella sp. 27cVA30]|uniref:thermonuclease family protein n=1 Tax=Legionella sp. 27cVA30 TaxID=2905657 RepID=UPI00209EB66D|nr:thermonuclease family protein [Legionella sp. 27cVA30]MCP0913241.1 thermonuclease family protein [Legionella sp. 27cVA30]